MDTNQKPTNDLTTDNQSDDQPIVSEEMDALLEEAKKIDQEVDVVNQEANSQIDVLEREIDESIEKVEGLCSELEQAEAEAEVEVDKLILERAQELAEEDQSVTE